MVSTIAWLDTSADEQRRVRELIAMFSEHRTLDELGVGQIRDVFSDALFPGTSTIQTRARYFLLVPWWYRAAAAQGFAGAQLRGQAERLERLLIEALRVMPAQVGVLGARAGSRVRRLPSDIYWGGLVTFGILRRDTAPDHLSPLLPRRNDTDELTTRAPSDWHPTMPDPPNGFPHALEGGLALRRDEAVWLRERILESSPDTLLAHLVGADGAPDPFSRYPWRDTLCATAPQPAAEVLRHAHLFSLAMEGASRLYGVLVAEAYEQAGFNTVSAPVERHRSAYLEWLDAVTDERHLLGAWDQEGFWALVRGRNRNVSPFTERFVRTWVRFVLDGSAVHALLDRSAGRRLIAERERAIKHGQARLSNQKLLGQWGNGIGGGLDFRWSSVKRIVNDIQEGLSRARA